MAEDTVVFEGFEPPQANFTRIPNAFLEAMNIIDTVGEMKVVYYILRHTWGFQDDYKKITLDEFQYGRKYRDGTRLDSGTGLTKPTIIDGLLRAEEHGFIEVEVDDRDAARVKKYYSLCMKSGVKKLDTCGKETLQPGKETLQRSEKETPERHSEKLVASPRPAPLQEEDDSDYYTELYYNDKKAVRRIGTANGGPWEVVCPSCTASVTIYSLDTWTRCHCGSREFKLLSEKPYIPPNGRKKHEAVEAYYAIVKSRGVRYGANEEYEADIARTVTDLPFWRQVVKEYIHPNCGGHPYGVDKMLVYYNECRLPGTRKAKEEEPPMPRYRPQEEVEAEMQNRKTPVVVSLPSWLHEPQAAIDERLERERLARLAKGEGK